MVGPSGAGKTTWVREQVQRGDLVLDLDDIFTALSFLPRYDKPQVLLPFVFEARDAVLNRLHLASEVGQSYLITSSIEQAMKWRQHHPYARLKLMAVDADECIRRLREEGRRDLERFERLIHEWWDKWGADVAALEARKREASI